MLINDLSVLSRLGRNRFFSFFGGAGADILNRWIELLVQLVDKVTSRTIWTKTFRVKGLAIVSFVFWVSVNVLQIVHAMCKLAFVSILALAILNELTTQLGLVATVVDLLLVVGTLSLG